MSTSTKGKVLPSMTAETHEQIVARLMAENAALKGKVRASMKVTEKGGVSLYGLGRFPVTLYKSQWEKLFTQVEDLKAFIAENETKLAVKA